MKILRVVILFLLMFLPFMVNSKECNLNDIEMLNVEINGKSDNTIEKSSPVIKNRRILLDIKMSEVGDYIEYKIILKNNSLEDFELDVNNLNTDYFEYSFITEDNQNIVKSNETKEVLLKVKYKSEVPDNKLVNGSYSESKDLLVNLSNNYLNNLNVNNPKTGPITKTIILIILLIILIGLYLVKRTKKIMILILGIFLLPVTTYALCKYGIEVDMKVEVEKTRFVYMYNILNHNTMEGTPVFLNQKLPDSLLTYNSREEINKIVYFKHKIKDDIVTESYLEFVVTEEMANTYPDVTEGVYSFRGSGSTYNESSNSYDNDSLYYEDNINTMKKAFKKAIDCLQDESYFTCRLYSLGHEIMQIISFANGSVIIRLEGDTCQIFPNGMSFCESNS